MSRSAMDSSAKSKDHKKSRRVLEKKWKFSLCPRAYCSEYYLQQHVKSHESSKNEDKFMCTVCGETYKWESNFKDHMNIHTGENKNVCGICKEDFTYTRALMAHKRAVHSISHPYECLQCDKAFKLPGHLANHMPFHTGERNFKCRVCQKGFATNQGRNNHEKKHSLANKTVKCDHCDFRCINASVLRDHVVIHFDERTYSCHLCSYTAKQRSALFNHLIFHGEKKYKCKQCDKRFFTPQILKNHKSTHMEERNEVCAVCNATFKDSRALKSHMRLHSNYKRYVCNICTKSFKYSDALRGHMRIHSGNKPYVCEICNLAFSHQMTLKRHMLVHSNVKKHQCEICHTKFKRRCGLNRHKKETHSNKHVAILSCEICKNTFFNEVSLKYHMRNHARVNKAPKSQGSFSGRPFSCQICQSSFMNLAMLKRHRDLHIGKISHVCDHCSRNFTSESGLRYHVRLHFDARARKFICGMCSCEFANKTNLLNHVKTCSLLLKMDASV